MAAPKKMRTIVVTPAKEGSRIPNPSTAKRLEYGQEYTVPDAKYWHRRIRDGSVKLVKGPAAAVPSLGEKPAPKPKTTRAKKSED